MHRITSVRTLLTIALLGSFPAIAGADLILIDLGREAVASPDDSGRYWNVFTTSNYANDPFVAELVRASDGADSGIGLLFTDAFSFNNTDSTVADPSLGYPVDAARDSLYGNTDPAQITLSGLDPSGTTLYDFTFFAARASAGNRTSVFNVTGLNSGNGSVNAAMNTSETAFVEGIIPDTTGQIVIDIDRAPGASHYYLNVIEIESRLVPEPASLALLSLGVLVATTRRR